MALAVNAVECSKLYELETKGNKRMFVYKKQNDFSYILIL